MESLYYLILITVCALNIECKKEDKYNLHMKTTHKPLYGDPPSRKNKGIHYKNDKYFNDQYKYAYYYEDDEDTYNVMNGNEGVNVVSYEKPQKATASESSPPDNNSGVETFKEGKDSDGKSPYGFVDGGDNGDFYVNNQEQAGLPFVGKADYGKGEQILDDPFRFHGGGAFQSNTVKQQKVLENCDNEHDVQYYCVQLKDGRYFDPWNPWCGYIACDRQTATRVTCSKGTWMGLSNVIRFTIKDMCRKRLPRGVKISDMDVCPELTDYELCKNAEEKENKET